MKAELKTPVIVAVAVVVLAVIVFFGWKAIASSGSLDQGQIQYTPGKPPWLETDPNKKGPGASPGAKVPGAPQQGAPGTAGASGQTAPITPGMPVGPPTIDNGKK